MDKIIKSHASLIKYTALIVLYVLLMYSPPVPEVPDAVLVVQKLDQHSVPPTSGQHTRGLVVVVRLIHTSSLRGGSGGREGEGGRGGGRERREGEKGGGREGEKEGGREGKKGGGGRGEGGRG